MKTKTQKHTPGPWRAESCGSHDEAGMMIMAKTSNAAGGIRSCLASVSNLHGYANANARLIAAAPEGLDLVKELQARLFVHEGNSDLYEKAGAWITKTEGGAK